MDKTRMRVAEPRTEGTELQELMRQVQNDDSRAFDELHRRVGGSVRTIFRRKGLGASRVEDLVQETFLQVLLARDTYEPTRPVKPWIYGIARNVYLMDQRATFKHEKDRVTREDFIEPAMAPEAERFADHARLRDALRRVRPERRTPFVMRHVWGYSYKEIAQALGIGESAAKVRTHRAKGELRTLLEETGQKAA